MGYAHLQARFMRFALAITQVTDKFPSRKVYFVITDQLIRSATSSAANYRAASRAKTARDFINKLKIVEEELDESLFWMEFTTKYNETYETELAQLKKEADELISIIVASIKTARKNLKENSSTKMK